MHLPCQHTHPHRRTQPYFHSPELSPHLLLYFYSHPLPLTISHCLISLLSLLCSLILNFVAHCTTVFPSGKAVVVCVCASECPGVCLCVFKSDLNNYKFQLYENQRQHTASNMTPYGNGVEGPGRACQGRNGSRRQEYLPYNGTVMHGEKYGS